MKKFLTTIGLMAVAIVTTSCLDEGSKSNTSRIEQQSTEANQQRLITSQPLPQLQTSLERKNLVERLERINAENMTGCIYLINHGAVMAFYPVRGKVTSLNAYLTGQEKVLDDPNGSIDAGSILIESPDLDGAYGENTDGVFFFTADTNAYVEWKGEYLWSDQCLRLNQQPLMIRQIND